MVDIFCLSFGECSVLIRGNMISLKIIYWMNIIVKLCNLILKRVKCLFDLEVRCERGVI